MSEKNKLEDLYPRVCSECNKGMSDGYCIDNGDWYFCSEACLHKKYTPTEWAYIYGDGEGDSYWTEWEEQDMIDDGIGYTKDGKEVCIDE